MELSHPDRPRVSRETRLLLSTALLAVLTLWILARVRFPDQPAATTPLQPLLTQIGTRGTFEDLALELAELRLRLEPLFVGAALRIRSDVALLPSSADSRELPPRDLIAADPASRVAVVRATGSSPAPPLPWQPADPEQPRYLIAAARHAGTLVLQPVLAGPLTEVSHPIWRQLWRLPAGTQVAPGSFVFTADARLAGLVVDLPDGPGLVPAAVLVEEVDRLLASGARIPGYVGVEVQPLTPTLAQLTGAATGVVVTWVDSAGPAPDILTVGDVIEAVDDRSLLTSQQWRGWIAGTPAGKTLTLRIRRGEAVRTAGLIAAPQKPQPRTAALGLRLRNLARTGSMVVDVEPGSVADRSGLRAGDVITRAGATVAPSPGAMQRAFDRAPTGGGVLVAYTRGGAHAVTALEKQ